MRNPFGPSGDDQDMNLRRDLDDRTADALLAGRDVDGEAELSVFVADVRASVQVGGVAPTVALMAMLDGGIPAADHVVETPVPQAVSWDSRRRGRLVPGRHALQLGLAVAACLALVLGGAVTNSLPAPAQELVADVVEAVTPLDVPRPPSVPRPHGGTLPGDQVDVPKTDPTGGPNNQVGETGEPGSQQDETGSGHDGENMTPGQEPDTADQQHVGQSEESTGETEGKDGKSTGGPDDSTSSSPTRDEPQQSGTDRKQSGSAPGRSDSGVSGDDSNG
jgi:hypothetical protein